MSLLWLLACIPDRPPEEVDVAFGAVEPSLLWAGTVDAGASIDLDGVVVASPLTTDSEHFFVQSVGGGERSGVRVLVDGFLWNWPPPVGTEVSLEGTVVSSGGPPTIRISEPGLELGVREVVRTSWANHLDLEHSLVRVAETSILGGPDPLGHLEINAAVDLGSLFGSVPAKGGGTLTGILSGSAVHPRTDEDWTGALGDLEPQTLALSEVGGASVGEWVRFEGVLATGWGLDRHGLVSAEGVGVWVDRQALGGEWLVEAGDHCWWSGEVVASPSGRSVILYEPPACDGQGIAHVGVIAEPGARVRIELEDLGPPDALGHRLAADGTVAFDWFGDVGGGDYAGLVAVWSSDPLEVVPLQ